MQENTKSIEILDVTLRDGEQTRGVSFNTEEKLNIAKYLLKNVRVNRIEVASARVSKGELHTVKTITEWAESEKLVNQIEILGFVDRNLSIDWVKESGAKTMNLLTKGSEKHLRLQLKKTIDQHLKEIRETILYGRENGIQSNLYLEDWSNGFLNSLSYVEEMVSGLLEFHTGKIFLADTLGILSPDEAYGAFTHMIQKFPGVHFEFHGHNDYDLSVANCLSATKAGIKGVHVSVNGLGERAGNSPLEAVVTALHDKGNTRTTVVENEITSVSKLVEIFSGKRISENRPIVGGDVFTQTAGVHADGDMKANLYANPILPERFGRKRSYALGKLAGKASISENLKEIGMVLSPDLEKKLLVKVIEMGDAGINVTTEDLPFLIADLSGITGEQKFEIQSWVVTSAKGVLPTASIAFRYNDKVYKESGTGDGGYDAIMDALRKLSQKLGFQLPTLSDYNVRIPPGGKSSALVETIITWEKGDENFRTVGLDSDQLAAAVHATEKMLNLI
ncbi:MAG: 2-isopropylmalate synthase [Leptospiraceae bacterium]|nr:2-isopropylmalate synthase [Leptospiraceae bacterium]MCP5512718.1 2-isopropylmalate synthase [Leptospiraceae bacterium]